MGDCCTKVAYGKRTARAAAKRLRSTSGEHFRAYPCDQCHHWHLTTTPSKKQTFKSTPHAKREPARTLKELEARARKLRGQDDGGE